MILLMDDDQGSLWDMRDDSGLCETAELAISKGNDLIKVNGWPPGLAAPTDAPNSSRP